jgi:uncharacterized DUF497 family protein
VEITDESDDDGNPGEAENVEWDDKTKEKCGNHQISFFDVQDVVTDPIVWVRNKHHGDNRWKAVGRNRGGRKLTIVVSYDAVRKSLRPITGWDATKEEIRKYFEKE